MDDILSQIIAYAPDKIDTELKARALVQAPRNIDQEPRNIDQEPRNMYNQGSSVDHAVRSVDPERDSFKKISNVLGAYRRYRRGEKNPALNFNQFFELYSTENFATGGSAGQLVQPNADGSRPGYGGPGSGAKPGVSKPVGPGTANPNYVSPMKNPETVAKLTKINRLKYQKTPVGERLQWIANNGKNYNNPENFIKAYEKHFNHKIGSKKDVLFNTPGKKALTQIDNLMNTGRAAQDLFTLKKGYNEEELFKASMIQNNPEIKKEFKNLFKDIHKDVSFYSELGPEGIVERLNKGKLLKEFDFIKYGVGSGITRNSLLNTSGVPTEHLTSYQNVRKPLQSLSQIIENLKNPSFAKQYKISPTTATKVRGQLENFFKGEKGLQTDIKKINNQLGDVKFNNIFGGVNFEHTLAKQFGKDYKYLPRNYLLKGQFTTKNFNMMKKDAFDLPLIKLMKQYEQGKVSGAKVQEFIDNFNAKTNNYADFKFDVDKGKLGYTDTKVSYDLSRYDNPNVARQELIDNIKLTQSNIFQKGMKDTVGSSNQLKLFKSKEAKEILSQLEKLGCGKSAGGRIMFGNGTTCAIKGREVLEKGLKNGFKKSDVGLAQKILGTGKFLKDAVSLRGLLGPAALAFTAAAEAGLVGYDMLSTGKSFREAVGDSVFNYALGDKTKIDSVEERDKRMVAEGMTPEQMGKIKYFESMMNDMQTGFKNYDNIKDLEKKIEDNTLNEQVNPEFFPNQAFQLDTQLDKAQAENQDYFRTNKVGGLENYFTTKEDGTMPFAQGASTLAEGLRRNELAQLQSVDNPLQSRKGDEKRSARIRELMLQNPDVRNYMGSYPSNYGFMEGGIASLNVNKKK